MEARSALSEVLSAHGVHKSTGAKNGQYSVEAVDRLISAMEILAQNQSRPQQTGDTLHINQSSGGTRVSIKGEKNSKSFNWEVNVTDTARGAEELGDVQVRCEKAFDESVTRMSQKYGAPTFDKTI